jgi:hypothetical protein
MVLICESRPLKFLGRSSSDSESRNLGLHPAHVALLQFQGHTFDEPGESDETEKPGRRGDRGRWFDSLANFWRFRSRFD